MSFLRAFVTFSRPHTILGTTISVTALYLMAVAYHNPANPELGRFWIALLSCLAANIYIVGLNQLTDVEIDRINKPYLPVASGAFSFSTGRNIVLMSLLIAGIFSVFGGKYLTVTVWSSLLIGTAYSLPPLRLKRFYFWAAACIFTVRGLIVNVFLFFHFQDILGVPPNLPPIIWLLTIFMFGISLVIALLKDIPDTSGDQQFAILTLAIRLGKQKVFALAMMIVGLAYLGVIFSALRGLPGVNNTLLWGTHLLVLLAILWRARKVNPEDKGDITRFYLTIWGIFLVEYVLFAASVLSY
jgi:homogentisate phytyltransferase/homogentisate geranylgeranyltransferase